MIEVILVAIYATCLTGMLFYSMAQLHLAVVHWRMRRVAEASPLQLDPGVLPFVTVQLPIYNERYVARRVIEHAARLDYPFNRFEIQVLDDSTDDTPCIVAETLDELCARGVTITYHRREHREGYKAGALRDALSLARGQYVAIFDADFCPASTFLRKTLPFFEATDVAVVQLRWGFLNEHYSILTRIQAFLLRSHFEMEQRARTGSGYFANFNGTGGIWRRAAIEDAGGWRAETLTEDLDLSYRAQLRGWRIVYLEHESCEGELPVDMAGFRTQQFRWMKGGAENARLHARTVLRSRSPVMVKIHACAHLFASSMYLLTLALVVLSVAVGGVHNAFITSDYSRYGSPFVIATIALFPAFYEAQWRLRGTGLRFVRWFVPMMVAFVLFTPGICLHNGLAALRGWLGHRTEFVRTPKYGIVGADGDWGRTTYAARRLTGAIWMEIALLLWVVLGLGIGWWRRDFAVYPIQLMALVGLTWVITMSMWHALRARVVPKAMAKLCQETHDGT